MDEIGDRLGVALELAEVSAAFAMRRYQARDLRVERKADGSPVTEVDLGVNEILLKGIGDAFGDDGILSEESGETGGRSGFRWVLDPIDGTSSYERGVPLFAVLIGIERAGVPVAGVAALPALGECVWGSNLGSRPGAWWRRADGEVVAARVSEAATLDVATIEAASATSFVHHGLEGTYLELARAARRVRGWSEGITFGLLATGRVDAAVSVSMSRWDVCAFVPIVEAAGGMLTSWTGRPAVESRRMLGSNGLLHEALMGEIGKG